MDISCLPQRKAGAAQNRQPYGARFISPYPPRPWNPRTVQAWMDSMSPPPFREMSGFCRLAPFFHLRYGDKLNLLGLEFGNDFVQGFDGFPVVVMKHNRLSVLRFPHNGGRDSPTRPGSRPE